MNFVAFDVETANSDPSSICQVGLVVYEAGLVVETWEQLVHPRSRFDGMNIAVHGISESDVASAPTFPEIFGRLHAFLAGRFVAHHTPFDRVAVTGAVARHGLASHEYLWLDTAKVARRTWSQYAKRGYGLANLAKDFAIDFRHHNASEDARAAGEVLIRALRETQLDLSGLAERIGLPAPSRVRAKRTPRSSVGSPDR